jgi:gamma-glutamylcyclotransferase (GGCT)/AIG2-like uncharacterized protein YtfP
MIEPGIFSILGEVYDIDQRTLKDLDYLEGHPHFYRRQLLDVVDHTMIQGYLYPGPLDHFNLVPPVGGIKSWSLDREHRRQG